jgi:hypothetical protein
MARETAESGGGIRQYLNENPLIVIVVVVIVVAIAAWVMLRGRGGGGVLAPACGRAGKHQVRHQVRATGPAAGADSAREVCASAQAVLGRQHPATSGGERSAALATAPGEDGSAGARAHAQAEAVRLGATAVVRLERTLAHE